MGTGGVGGYFGALLAKSGEDVVFIARGEHLQAIKKNGLQIRSPKGDFTIKSVATDNPSELDPVDLILFCVKGYDTEDAARKVKPLVSKDTTAISLQNGVEKEEILGSILGADHVMGGLCTLSAYIEAPGIIKHEGLERLVFGEIDGRESDRAEQILEVFKSAGINASLSTNVVAEEWEKFAFICAVGGLCSLTGLPVGPILHFEGTKQLYESTMTEIIEIAREKGVSLSDDALQRLLNFSLGLNPDIRPSMYRDLINKRRSEIDILNGAVVRLGREFNVSTPTNDFIFACLDAIDRVNLGTRT
ncbi:MAG: ketopantoate reductase family protein [Candidatus Thorarchaeota archaeon]